MHRLDLIPVDSLITGPTREPLDLTEVKKKLFNSIDSQLQDTIFDGYITAARQYFETMTGRQIMTATWETWLDAFPCWRLEIPKPPLLSVLSVKYIAADGTLTTVDAATYQVKAPVGSQCARGWIEPVSGGSWPVARCESGAVRVQFRAGYGNTLDAVPDFVKSALYLIVAEFHKSDCAGDTTKPALTPSIGLDLMLREFKTYARPMFRPLDAVIYG